MGLKPNEVAKLTLSDFNLMYIGYRRRQENDWDIARRTWAYIVTFGGMGVKDGKSVDPKNLYPLYYSDRSDNDTVKKITTLKQAIDLLNKF